MLSWRRRPASKDPAAHAAVLAVGADPIAQDPSSSSRLPRSWVCGSRASSLSVSLCRLLIGEEPGQVVQALQVAQPCGYASRTRRTRSRPLAGRRRPGRRHCLARRRRLGPLGWPRAWLRSSREPSVRLGTPAGLDPPFGGPAPTRRDHDRFSRRALVTPGPGRPDRIRRARSQYGRPRPARRRATPPRAVRNGSVRSAAP
jgi:hypothetical protein